MTEPLRIRWDRTVIHSTGPGDDAIVCCLDQHGHPVALFLDDELREALGLSLLLPEGDGEVDVEQIVRAAAFREAARVVEQLGHSDDAVAVLDNIASGIAEMHADKAVR
jgi:hypothetical protein